MRAAKLIVPMALAPMAVPWILGLAHPELYQVAIRAANFEKISEDGLFLLLGAFTAIFGTHTINTLRTEAYEARLLNQYRLGRKLGGGGMGEVYLAEHQLLKRPCAIKLIRHDLVGNQRVFARFEREVRATARLSHWNTIEIFDYGRNDDGAFYYVMEYLPGLSLADLVERFGPMPAARVIYLLRQACDALDEAHDSGLIHRDIKPANLMAAYRGGQYDVTKMLDFGLVKTLTEDESVHLSQEGTVAGSPLYMAPEQVMHNQPPDRPTDIYGLGAVAYFMLTGRPPFMGQTAMEVMVAHARDPVIPPSQMQRNIPLDLEAVVLRCLAKNPKDRYPDTPSLAEALDACADAANWSPAHAADWWQATELEPGENTPRRSRSGLPPRESPVPSSSRQPNAGESCHVTEVQVAHRHDPDRRRSSRPKMPQIQVMHDERASGPTRSSSPCTWRLPSISATRSTSIAHGSSSRANPGSCPAGDEHPNRSAIGRPPSAWRSSRPASSCPASGRFCRPPRGELTLFDFGAISLAVQFRVQTTADTLLALAGRLAEQAPLTEAARQLLAPWLERIRPSVQDFAVSAMTEEYVIFQLGRPRYLAR